MAVGFSWVSYMTTGAVKNNPKENMEVTLKSSDVDEFSKKMDKQGYKYDSFMTLNAEQASKYLQALNGIVPKKAEINTDLNPKHLYTLSNRGSMLQLRDDFAHENVVTICHKSINEEEM